MASLFSGPVRKRRGRRPPRRSCVVCGRDVYTWSTPPVHRPECLGETGLGAMLGEERRARWAARDRETEIDPEVFPE